MIVDYVLVIISSLIIVWAVIYFFVKKVDSLYLKEDKMLPLIFDILPYVLTLIALICYSVFK